VEKECECVVVVREKEEEEATGWVGVLYHEKFWIGKAPTLGSGRAKGCLLFRGKRNVITGQLKMA
jgi:hypothetical protein